MDTEKTETETVIEETNGGEGGSEVETLAIPKKDYETLNQTLGSLKREIKDLKKSKEEPKETLQTKTEEFGLLQKTFLRAASITAEDEIELARDTAKKWGVDIDKLVDDDDWKQKLDKFRTKKSNELATSNIRGSGGTQQTKNTPEYWIAKGTPPSTTDVPDRKTRAKIARAMMDSTKNSKKFYND